MKEWGTRENRELFNDHLGSGRYKYFPSLSCQHVHKPLMLIIIHTEIEGDVAGVFDTHA